MSTNPDQSSSKATEKKLITNRFSPYIRKKNNIKGIDSSRSITTMKKIHHWHSWEIKEFDRTLRVKTIKSSPFVIKDYGDSKWYLQLSYEENLKSTSGYHYMYSLSLHIDGELRVLPVDFELGFINVNNDFFLSRDEKTTLSKCLGGYMFLINEKLQKDSLKIGCRITLMEPSTSSFTSVIDLETPSFDFTHDFGRLLKDKKTADIRLHVGNTKFYAHKTILIARSSVFAAMLEEYVKEDARKKIVISDLSAEVIEAVLTFIYTNDVKDFGAIAVDLLRAAHKYNLEKLKVMCEKTIADMVNVENAAEILVVADQCKALRLKTHVSYFIKSFMTKVVATNGFKKMKENHPQIFLEIIKDLVVLAK